MLSLTSFLSTEGGIATKAIGPINEWWTAGFDGGDNVVIGITTGTLELAACWNTSKTSHQMYPLFA